MDLTPTQQHALTQLLTLTNGEPDVAKAVLESVDWNVQEAADLIFDTGPAAVGPSLSSSSPGPRRPIASFDLDDSQQLGLHNTTSRSSGGHHRRRRSYSFLRYFPPVPNSILSLLAFPLHLISSIFRFIFGVLRIPIPQLRFASLSFYRPFPTAPSDPRSVADRWVRALEDETGAVCISRAGVPDVAASSGADAGPSNMTYRTGATGVDNIVFEDGRKLLPDFTLGSYEDMLGMCQRDAKIGCVILVSEEHDDVKEFKRSTLTDPVLVKLLHENEIVVWGGDVRDKEAWSAAQKLQATTYPFVAFLALQPRRGPSAASSRASSASAGVPPTLTILSRHQGRCVPDSAPTSAATLTDHLLRQLLPRVSPFLERIKATARDRERDRVLREDQDRAFKDSARRDRERIQAKMAEERRVNEEKKLQAEAARLEEERLVAEKEEAGRREAVRMDWRKWARKALVENEPVGEVAAIRIAIRLPGGDGRSIRRFSSDATLTTLYAYVDSQFIPTRFSPLDDPDTPPATIAAGETGIEQQIQSALDGSVDDWWGFKLVLTYPRRELHWQPKTRLADVDGLKGGAQIVVEKIGRLTSSSRATSPTEDDYDTESD